VAGKALFHEMVSETLRVSKVLSVFRLSLRAGLKISKDPKGFCNQSCGRRFRVAGKALFHEMVSETLRVSKVLSIFEQPL
jgi:hypothetical protein